MGDKNILILSSWFPSEAHPFLGNFVERQAKLISREYNVTVINTFPSDSVHKITLKEINGEYRLIEASYPNKKNFLVRKYLEKKAFQRALKKLNSIDLVIGNVLLPKGWQFILAKKRFQCPLFYIEHGSYFRDEAIFAWRKIDYIIKRQIERQADAIFAVSEFLKKDMQRIFPESDIEIIGNHVDTQLFSYQEKKSNQTTQFLHISTLDEQTKNFKEIIDACVILKNKGKSFHLLVISDEDFAGWQSVVNELGMQDQISFKGPVDWEKVPYYYQSADVFVLNSNYESFSIVIAESLATGTPIISTPVGIAAELDTNYGIFIDTNDVTSLSNAMMRFTPSNFDSNLIRNFAQKYSSDSILLKWKTKIDAVG